MQIPQHPINPKHRDALRSVLARKSAQVLASSDHAAANSSIGFFRHISKKRKWEFGMTGLTLATGLAIAAIILVRQPLLSTQEFIEAAQAAYRAQPLNENGIVHQKYVVRYDDATTAANTMTIESWSHKDGYANIMTDATGKVMNKRVAFVDPSGIWRGFDSNPLPDEIITAPQQSTREAIFCTVNSADLSDNHTTASASTMTRALENGAATQSRTDAIEQILQSTNVKDLGERDGSRCFQITTDDFVYVYSFDPKTYALKEYTEEPNHPNHFGQSLYTNSYEYLIDETLDARPLDLPIFSDLTGLTEVVLNGSPIPNIDQLPTGCYNEHGEAITTTRIMLTDDGSVYMVEE